MVGSGRIIGLVLIALGAIVGILGVIYWIGNQQTDSTAKTLGIAICGLRVAVIAGFGVWFLMQGRSETAQFAEVEKEKRILNIIATQGTVQLANLSLETNMPIDQVKAAIYDLVG